MFQHSLIKPSILTLNLSPKSLGALRCFSSLMLLITAPKILLWEEVMVGGHGGGQEEPVANLDTSTLLHCLSCHPPWFSCSRFACCEKFQMTRLINCKICGYDIINIAPRPDLVARRSSPSPPPPPRDWADRPPGSQSWLSLLNPGWEILLSICSIYLWPRCLLT